MSKPNIYPTINTINNKIYIGQTNGNDPYYRGSGTELKKDLKKYGREKFIRTILIEGDLSKEELTLWEKFYIKLFDARNSEIGYNISDGKGSVFKHTPEAIIKIREANLRPERRQKQVETNRGNKYRTGARLSKEQLLKANKTRYGNRIIQIFSNSELVYECYLISEASEFTGMKKSAIRNHLCGLSRSSKSYTFRYREVVI